MNKWGDLPNEDGLKTSQIIKQLQQQLSTAPDTDKVEEASKNFVTVGNYGGKRVQGYCLKDGKKAILTVDDGVYGNQPSAV